MEAIFNRLLAALASGAPLAPLQPQFEELTQYYTSPLWLSDLDDDRAGRIPADLPRGVLSEDGIWDLMSGWAEARKRG